MNDNPALDARSAANCVLDAADALGLPITNLALQKLIYFAHGLCLTAERRPLVTGYFEAWAYGPVHPQIYAVFRHAGAMAINTRAMSRDYATGRYLPVAQVRDPAIKELISRVVVTLAPLPAGRLVELSHVNEGPWHQVVNEARTRDGRGIRIYDTVIAERFPRHKLDVGALASGDGPVEESLLTA